MVGNVEESILGPNGQKPKEIRKALLCPSVEQGEATVTLVLIPTTSKTPPLRNSILGMKPSSFRRLYALSWAQRASNFFYVAICEFKDWPIPSWETSLFKRFPAYCPDLSIWKTYKCIISREHSHRILLWSHCVPT